MKFSGDQYASKLSNLKLQGLYAWNAPLQSVNTMHESAAVKTFILGVDGQMFDTWRSLGESPKKKSTELIGDFFFVIWLRRNIKT